jgi:hypothetical protein
LASISKTRRIITSIISWCHPPIATTRFQLLVEMTLRPALRWGELVELRAPGGSGHAGSVSFGA